MQEESDGLRDRTPVEVDVGKGLSRKWDRSRLKPGYSQLRLTWLPVSKVSSQRAAGSARSERSVTLEALFCRDRVKSTSVSLGHACRNADLLNVCREMKNIS